MHGLLRFLVRFHAFFLFLFLEVLCFALIVRYNRYQQSTFLNTTHALTSTAYNRYNNLYRFLNLRAVNDSLAVENLRMQEELIALRQYRNEHWDTASLSPMLKTEFFHISANVIHNSLNKSNNYLTINKGARHGVAPEMGVTCASGIVGIVTTVSQRFATVMPLLNERARFSALLEKSGYPGIVKWNGINSHYAFLEDVPKHVPIKIGDKVITSGYSSVFARGIPIGKVDSFSTTEGENFYDITIRLTTNFETLNYVYVMDYKTKVERSNLEAERQ